MSALAVLPSLAASETTPRLVINVAEHGVFLDGAEVSVTRKELELLALLAPEPSALLFKDDLIARLWGWRDGKLANTSRALDAHASRLRPKLTVGTTQYVVNVWGRGYRLVEAGREHEVRVVGVPLLSVESPLGDALDAALITMDALGESLARLGGELRRASRLERDRLEKSRHRAVRGAA